MAAARGWAGWWKYAKISPHGITERKRRAASCSWSVILPYKLICMWGFRAPLSRYHKYTLPAGHLCLIRVDGYGLGLESFPNVTYLSTFNHPKTGDFMQFVIGADFAVFYLVTILDNRGHVSGCRRFRNQTSSYPNIFVPNRFRHHIFVPKGNWLN